MSLSRIAALYIYAAFTIASMFGGIAMAQDPAVTSYGDKNSSAPDELDLFSFLPGKWEGAGRTRIEDGTYAEFEMTWIGRYILDGMAIADEFHASAPDGSPYLGISLRQYDSVNQSWIVEYLNVTGSFIRRQVNPRSGTVTKDGDTVMVTSISDDSISRENYRVIGSDGFVYSIELSNDGGETWDTDSFEVTMTRVE